MNRIIAKIKNPRIILLGIVVIIVLVFFAQQFITTTNKKTKAAVDRAQVTFILTPKHDFLPEEEFILGVRATAAAGKKISAVNLYIKYDSDNKEILDYIGTDSYVPANYFNDVVIETKPVPRVSDAKLLHLVLVAKKSDDQLINSAQINLRFKMKKTTNEIYNTTQFSLASNSQIVGSADNVAYEIDASSSDVINQLKSCTASSDCGINAACTNTICICNTGFYNCDETWTNGCESNATCSVPTLTPTNIPSGTGPGITLNLKLKFQGIMKKPADNLNQMDVKIKIGGDSLSAPVNQTVKFVADDNGIWTGSVNFSSVQPGNGYILYIKGPKHLQKKICDVDPDDKGSVGSYFCRTGNYLKLDTINTLDFSNIWLLSGDLPEQDGIVDSYDGSLIRNNLGSTTEPKCDINLDGICDSQDWSLLIQSLSVKYDEE